MKALSIVQRRVRSELFQHSVRTAYANSCGFCGQGLLTPSQIPEVEAAHIIPRRANGSNDARNGLALCRSHHWAFDQLLWTLAEDNKIVIRRSVRRMSENEKLAARIGKVLLLPDERRLSPATQAIEHHRQRVLRTWGRL